MSYSLSILWHERSRYFAAVLAVAFSAVLICTQFGVLLGAFALTSIPIDNARADIWLGGPDIASVDVGKPIPKDYRTRLANQPEVHTTEFLLVGFDYWSRPDGGAELCIVVGSNLSDESLGAVPHLTPHLRSQLTEPGAIVVDESELGRLGIRGVGDVILVGQQKTRVVGLVRGLPSLQGPYVFCSVDTARHLLHMKSDQTIYVLGKCYDSADAEAVADRMKVYPEISVLSAGTFSMRSQWHWLTKTHAGVALGFAAVLGLIVGAVVTRQALYSATIASIREYAVLRAMGIPRWRMAVNLALLSFWVGLVGAMLAVPGIYGVRQVMTTVNVPLLLPWWLVFSSVLVTWIVAILAGLSTLNSLRQVEPMILLR